MIERAKISNNSEKNQKVHERLYNKQIKSTKNEQEEKYRENK